MCFDIFLSSLCRFCSYPPNTEHTYLGRILGSRAGTREILPAAGSVASRSPARIRSSLTWMQPLSLPLLKGALSRKKQSGEKRTWKWGFPGGAVVENLTANAGDTGSSPGLGRSHMPRSNWAREPQLLSLRVWSLCPAMGGAVIVKGPCTAMKSGPRTAMKSGPRLPQLEKALARNEDPTQP